MSDAVDRVPCRPWTLTLEVVHLEGPPFDLDQHGDMVEELIHRALRDMTLRLPGGTVIRIESHMRRSDLTDGLKVQL